MKAAGRFSLRVTSGALALGLALTAPALQAQTPPAAPAAEPATREIIEALSPKLRSLRNLGVRPRETPAAASAPAESAPGTSPAEPPSAAPVAPPEPPPPGISLQIAFDFDSARIRPDSSRVLARLAEALRSPELAEGRFRIEGHTDARGAAAYNQRLSTARAEAVAAFLVQRGVPADRVQAVGRGASEPANPQDPLAADNRRVHVANVAP